VKIKLDSLGELLFEVKGEERSYQIDVKKGSPLEYFLGGMITCSAVDILELPKKAGKEVKNLTIDVDAQKSSDRPNRFTKIHIVYSFDSDVDGLVARRWVLASLESYCTSINSLRAGVKIEYSIVYNGEKIANNEQIMSGHGE